MKSGKYKTSYHVDCIHKEHLVNQGITFCFKGDIRHCDECQYREPADIESEISYASIETNESEIKDALTSPKEYGMKLMNKKKKK